VTEDGGNDQILEILLLSLVPPDRVQLFINKLRICQQGLWGVRPLRRFPGSMRGTMNRL
jgi:hypothetical protein